MICETRKDESAIKDGFKTAEILMEKVKKRFSRIDIRLNLC